MSDGPETAGARQVRDGAGRWKKGISGNPSGRPRGARNHATTAAAALLDGEAEALAAFPPVGAILRAGRLYREDMA
ncbi:hypothetical protein LNKW23_08480 [Paralimibaculum aggregatum]|uniref:DUF5681 domain-containing protein n=1 Tax=Paralimibaculum aggregatum TaxID=3036245 RepID=A0ABQ6LHD2_9RHOB|nr:DUF5681 domain-containing protein [Limibaculum sp. NKW23]GMG81635.1 hypothetical protein LNKW23_08480 [Limibaculum sp. NKW23]